MQAIPVTTTAGCDPTTESGRREVGTTIRSDRSHARRLPAIARYRSRTPHHRSRRSRVANTRAATAKTRTIASARGTGQRKPTVSTLTV